MGIDIGFVSEDLARCARAKCAEQRSTVVGFVEQVDGQLLTVQRLDTGVVQQDAPDRYRPTVELGRDHFALVGLLHKVAQPAPEGMAPGFIGGMQGFRYALVPQLVIGEQEFESRITQGSLQQDEDAWRINTAWDEVLTWEARRELCLSCPLRPLDEDSCYARFSNYPGMASFKMGLAVAIAAMARIDQEMQESQPEQDPFAWWTFRGLLARTGHSSLRDLHCGVQAYLGEETQAHMLNAERFFDQVTDMVNNAWGGTEGAQMEPVPKLAEVPRQSDVETLLAGLIYRAEPYEEVEMAFLLPRLYAYLAAAEWALWDTQGNPKMQGLLLGFLDRWRTLLEMLRAGWLMGLRVFVSY